ncbi:MAG: efflux RND transporter periplasmic adaptor subunit [Desulfomonile tiedjei]|nr:efflux RND transporter periplasmic adaptor subunit [Desulfomonile tiedjei]
MTSSAYSVEKAPSVLITPGDPEPFKQIEPPDFLDQSQQKTTLGKIEATIINPFRSAAIAAEVSGIIEHYNFEVGDHVKKGVIIAEISKKRYALGVERAKQSLDAFRIALKRAQKDKEIKEKLVSLDASSVQELLRAEAEAEITEQKIHEAETLLKQALLDLEACQVKAPFSGYLAIRYKEPFEAVGSLEKMFTLVDSSKVYAVAYVPENLMPLFKKGAKAAFNDSSGRQFVGEVDKIEPIIDPKTGTQKIFVLMNNAEEQLAIGMSGALESVQ